MQITKIIALSILSAVVYGIVHDQITARICVEYFTIGHPPIFNTTSPTLLGLGWGIVATWWFGFILGVPLALISRIGSRPKIDARQLKRPLTILMLGCGACALIAGIVGYGMALSGNVWLLEPRASQVPRARHVAYLTDLWIHNASYLTGSIGGLILMGWVWQMRKKIHITVPAAVKTLS